MKRIEICGGIGSGKTTLATLLSCVGFQSNLENFLENPFWEAFYKDPRGTAFETELTFFLQHYHKIKGSITIDKPIVCDHSLLLDLAYARTTLRHQKLSLFESVFQEIWRELPPPEIVINLRCDPRTELDRIKARGRSVEEKIQIDYLSALNDSISLVMSEYAGEVFFQELDSEQIDFSASREGQEYAIQIVLSALNDQSVG